MSVPAAVFMRRYGYKKGCWSVLFVCNWDVYLPPAALNKSYVLFLLALFVIASGLGFLETGANPLIAHLGSPNSSVRRLNLAKPSIHSDQSPEF